MQAAEDGPCLLGGGSEMRDQKGPEQEDSVGHRLSILRCSIVDDVRFCAGAGEKFDERAVETMHHSQIEWPKVGTERLISNLVVHGKVTRVGSRPQKVSARCDK